jgi:Uma2 family endonuclease
MSEVVTSPPVDRRLFSLHEEEDVVEVSLHRRQVVYFETNLQIALPDRFVGANMGVYWVPGQLERPWAGPDVFVGQGRPQAAAPRIWLVWEDGPLQFVAEVASERTRTMERQKREETYRVELQVPEYLYIDLDRHQLELWRLRDENYEPVGEEGGRLYSEELGVWFGWDTLKPLVRIWTAGGRMLPTAEEKEEQLQEEAARRLEAEQQLQEEAARRLEAEQQLQEEAARRLEAEARAAALAAELERLRGGAD